MIQAYSRAMKSAIDSNTLDMLNILIDEFMLLDLKSYTDSKSFGRIMEMVIKFSTNEKCLKLIIDNVQFHPKDIVSSLILIQPDKPPLYDILYDYAVDVFLSPRSLDTYFSSLKYTSEDGKVSEFTADVRLGNSNCIVEARFNLSGRKLYVNFPSNTLEVYQSGRVGMTHQPFSQNDGIDKGLFGWLR